MFPSQACHIEGGSAGLIPSQLLEEKRKAFVKRDLELATTGMPQQHAAEQGSTSHYADLTQTPRCTNSRATKATSVSLHIIQAFHLALGPLSLLSPLQSATLVSEHWTTDNEHRRDSGSLIQSAGY